MPATLGVKRVKTGCLTCRMRRIKCDEAKPSCKQCSLSGRSCDGYSSLPFSRRDIQAAIRNPSSSAGLLPRLVTDPAFSDVLEKRYFQFFRQKTVASSNSLIDCRFWDRIVPQLAHSEPTIKHVVLALSSLHQLSDPALDHELKRQHRLYAEKQYGRALRAATVLAGNAQDLDQILVACILFFCYEGIRGDYDAGRTHMRAAQSIVTSNHERLNQVSRRSDLIEIEQALSRFDVPAIAFSGASLPLDLTFDDFVLARPVPTVPDFDTAAEARSSLMELVRWVFLAYSLLSKPCRVPDPAFAKYPAENAKCAVQVQVWHDRFESQVSRKYTFAPPLLVNLLRLWHSLAVAVVKVDLTGPEMRWDAVQMDFESVITLAESVAQSLAKSESETFSMELGYTLPVFIVATKCRDPPIRRRALAILESIPRQEGMWHSTGAAAIARRYREVEEGGVDGPVRNASDISEHLRIQDIKTSVSVPESSASILFTLQDIEGHRTTRSESVHWDAVM